MPSSSQRRRAVFGPRPGRRMNVATSAGTSPFFFVSAWISPSSTTCTIFSSIVFPIPCSSLARPSSASCATELPVSRIRVAARRYAVTRKLSAPSSSIRSASRSNCAARSGFLGSVRATTSMIRSPMRATVCLPTYNERENLEMDCDFSHDPNDVLRLIAAAEGGADLALGSRYAHGGSIPNWGLVRRAISLGGNLYAQAVLQSSVRDLTGGFKCFRRRVLETIDLDAIDSRGYAFQIETTYRVLRAGFRVVEVPIAFVDREHGHSKMSRAIVLEAVWKVPLVRLQALKGRL